MMTNIYSQLCSKDHLLQNCKQLKETGELSNGPPRSLFLMLLLGEACSGFKCWILCPDVADI
jgi:hypothetical protein